MRSGKTPANPTTESSTQNKPRVGDLQAREARLARRKEKRKIQIMAAARLGAIIPVRFTTSQTTETLSAVSTAAMRYIHAVTGESSTAEARYQEYISGFGTLNRKKSIRALANLIPGLPMSKFEGLKTLMAAYDYVFSLQRVQQRSEESKTTKTEEVARKRGREKRNIGQGDDSDEVEYLVNYDKSKRARLPEPNTRTERATRVKSEEARAISQSDKHYISISLGRMKSRSLSEVSMIIERNAPRFFDAFMDGTSPDTGILPDQVVEQLRKFAYDRTPPKSLRSMILMKAKEESQEEEDMMDVDDQDEGTNAKFMRSSAGSAQKGGKTSYMIIDSMRREIQGLQAALRACGKQQDDLEDFLSKITRGKTINKALVEMGWKADCGA